MNESNKYIANLRGKLDETLVWITRVKRHNLGFWDQVPAELLTRKSTFVLPPRNLLSLSIFYGHILNVNLIRGRQFSQLLVFPYKSQKILRLLEGITMSTVSAEGACTEIAARVDPPITSKFCPGSEAPPPGRLINRKAGLVEDEEEEEVKMYVSWTGASTHPPMKPTFLLTIVREAFRILQGNAVAV